MDCRLPEDCGYGSVIVCDFILPLPDMFDVLPALWDGLAKRSYSSCQGDRKCYIPIQYNRKSVIRTGWDQGVWSVKWIIEHRGKLY